VPKLEDSGAPPNEDPASPSVWDSWAPPSKSPTEAGEVEEGIEVEEIIEEEEIEEEVVEEEVEEEIVEEEVEEEEVEEEVTEADLEEIVETDEDDPIFEEVEVSGNDDDAQYDQDEISVINETYPATTDEEDDTDDDEDKDKSDDEDDSPWVPDHPFDEPPEEFGENTSWGNPKRDGTNGEQGVFKRLGEEDANDTGEALFQADVAKALEQSKQDVESGTVGSKKNRGAPAAVAGRSAIPNGDDDGKSKSTTNKSRDHSGGLPPPTDRQTQRYRCLLGCVIVVGLIAIAAVILPFVLDEDNGGNPGPRATEFPTPVVPTEPPLTEPTPTSSPEPTPTAPIAPTPLTPPPNEIAPTAAPIPPTVSPAPTTSRLARFIEVFLIPVSGEEVFEDRNSAQYRAAEFIADDDEFISEVTLIEELADRYAATTFYFATEGDEWNFCSRNDANCPSPWLVGDVCGWFSVSCNEAGRINSIVFGQ
jgi:hypothetical protein